MLVTSRRQFLLVVLLFVTACRPTNEPEPGTGPLTPPPEANWVVRTAVGPGNSLIQNLAASPTSYVVGAAVDLIAYNTADGSVRWRRTDVPARGPVIVDDTLLVTLMAGESAAMRLRDGTVLWRTPVAGAASSYQSVRVGRLGIVTGFDGEVSSVDLYTGATRLIGTAAALLGTLGTRVHGFAVANDTLYVVGQVQPGPLASEFGPILIAAVEPVTGAVLSRNAVPIRPRDVLFSFRPRAHGSLLIVPTAGSVIAIDRTTWAVRWRDSSSNVAAPVIRDGKIYTGDGIGDVVVRDIETGALVRRVRTNTASIGALYPCREGIFFASGALWRLPLDSDRVRSIYPGEAFSSMAWSSGKLFVNAVDVELALRCT